jgi:NAD(P)-dependent dehydrogenase (short-subunit alcohol dehydrogenase family)
MKTENNKSNQHMAGSQARLQRVVVMTGATAGLGAHAAKLIAREPNTRILIGARGSGREVPKGAEVLPLDLASLASVRAFADAVIDKLGNDRIQILVLNAGMQTSKNEKKSADGYELIFAVNHLAHYLLARLLMPYIADHGRLVITTSDTHDPAVTPIAPKALEPQTLAYPAKGGLGSGIRAYAASKLCNLLTAQAFADLTEVKDRQITVIAFNPGFTGGTSLGRDSSVIARIILTILINTVFRIVGLFRPEYVISTAERSGDALARIVMSEITTPAGKIYISLVKGKPTFPNPSDLARSRDAQALLWSESATMVGLD